GPPAVDDGQPEEIVEQEVATVAKKSAGTMSTSFPKSRLYFGEGCFAPLPNNGSSPPAGRLTPRSIPMHPMKSLLPILSAVVLALWSGGHTACAADPDRALLREARIATDEASLLTYLRGRCGDDADLSRVGE